MTTEDIVGEIAVEGGWIKDISYFGAVAPGIFCSLVVFVFVFFTIKWIMKQKQGNEKLVEIGDSIKDGAKAFMMREYKIVLGFIVIGAILITFFVEPESGEGWKHTVHFIFGSVLSTLSGIIGMSVSIRANTRTAAAAEDGIGQALKVAFYSGTVMGMTTVAFVVFGQSVLYLIFKDDLALSGFGLGASLVALFARCGGGIFTKAADVGADLVGKVEKNIPEDDPRNPATIADNVGDNVGDVAGLGSDLYESYVGALVAAVPLGNVRYGNMNGMKGVALPFWVSGFGMIACILGTFLVRTKEDATQESLLNTLRRGVFSAAGLVVVSSILSSFALFESEEAWKLVLAVIIGLMAGILVGIATEYTTSHAYAPTRSIVYSSETGPATVIIQGFSVGMISTMAPGIILTGAMVGAYYCAGGYGISIAAVGMLSTLGITLATDAYGPVADNAGGIAEMANMPEHVRQRTDALDALGNTTAATGKGFAIGSAVLTTLALISAFASHVGLEAAGVDLLDILVLAGVFIGGTLPFVFAALTMMAVGKAAGCIITEVRRQFNDDPGIMAGTSKPDYASCVDIVTKASLREMMGPGIMAISVPPIMGFLLGTKALAGMLTGCIVSAFLIAVTMANAGGAWDNAKKYVEEGHLGKNRQKGSENHHATVIGDTVGDPFKDTSGPSLDILCKLMSHFALLLSGQFTDNYDKWPIGVILLVLAIVLSVGLYWLVEKFQGKIVSITEMMEIAKQNEAAAEAEEGEPKASEETSDADVKVEVDDERSTVPLKEVV